MMLLALTISGLWWLLLAVPAVLGLVLIETLGSDDLIGWPGPPRGCLPAFALAVLSLIVSLLLVALRVSVTIGGEVTQ